MGDEPPAKRRLLQQIANMTEEEAAKVGALLSSSASAQPTTTIVNHNYGGNHYNFASGGSVFHNSTAANQAYKQAAFGQTTLRLSGLNPPKNPASTFINVSISRTSSRTRRA